MLQIYYTRTYTPIVTPVKPEGTPAESEGPKGQPQTGTPVFVPGNPNVPIDETVKRTFDDGTTEKKVPGEGIYTIDENGKVTFTPEPDFVGKATGVTVKRAIRTERQQQLLTHQRFILILYSLIKMVTHFHQQKMGLNLLKISQDTRLLKLK